MEYSTVELSKRGDQSELPLFKKLCFDSPRFLKKTVFELDVAMQGRGRELTEGKCA